MKGVVTENISEMNPGEVKVDGKRWTSVSTTTLTKGENVRILKIEGVKLYVERWEE